MAFIIAHNIQSASNHHKPTSSNGGPKVREQEPEKKPSEPEKKGGKRSFTRDANGKFSD